jgi:hypothetical protein
VNGDGLESPVDPHVQQFVRNMLSDLQRPAAPTRVVARRLKRSTRVTVTWVDPRIDSVLVFRHRGPGSFSPGDPGVTKVCQSRSAVCLDTVRLKPGLYRYSAIVIDQWGRSQPGFTAPVRVREAKRVRPRKVQIVLDVNATDVADLAAKRVERKRRGRRPKRA